MRKAFAVALLDCRRLGFALVSGALVVGLVPALASGLGTKIPASTLLVVVFALVGVAAGGYFGADFIDGRSSFFFARPLPTWALIGGRFAGLLALAAGAFVAFMGSHWLSSNDRSGWRLFILTSDHAAALGTGWAVSLFTALAHAAQGPVQRQERQLKEFITVPLRIGLISAAAIVTFGLFADLLLRAYISKTPAKIFFGSWIVASFIASCVAIAAGRTERLRIARFQNGVVFAHAALACASVIAAWAYVLHPAPSAIQRVDVVKASPDGRFAYVSATVDRGDEGHFKPVFVLDIASGQVRRLNADPNQGPWTSSDGANMVWAEATPFFFRTLLRLVGGPTPFRMQTQSGAVEALPMPETLTQGALSQANFLIFGVVRTILPSIDGDRFAVAWGQRLTFMSRSRGQVSEIDFGPTRSGMVAAAFRPSGTLRASLGRQDGPKSFLEFVDIDPATSAVTRLATLEEGTSRVFFDAMAERVLIASDARGGRRSISMLDLTPGRASTGPVVLVANGINPSGRFLSDGRIVTTSGVRSEGTVTVFSAIGVRIAEFRMEGDAIPLIGGEMFPGVLGLGLVTRGSQDLGLLDLATGAVIRRIPGLFSPMLFSPSAPPPGSAAARLVQSRDGKLYELPSPTAELRLLLPLPRR